MLQYNHSLSRSLSEKYYFIKYQNLDFKENILWLRVSFDWFDWPIEISLVRLCLKLT